MPVIEKYNVLSECIIVTVSTICCYFTRLVISKLKRRFESMILFSIFIQEPTEQFHQDKQVSLLKSSWQISVYK